MNAALPQTQCTRCGYADCAGYAQAIAANKAGINQCPPGGTEGIRRLSAITGLPIQPMNPLNGAESPRSVAFIDEAWCIGCTLCIKACPVDAIVGSNKLMHTVIESACTGCELCLPACPVDCILLDNASGVLTGWGAWSAHEADAARGRYELHSVKINSSKRKEEKMPEIIASPLKTFIGEAPVLLQHGTGAADRKRAVIQAAMDRARAGRGTGP